MSGTITNFEDQVHPDAEVYCEGCGWTGAYKDTRTNIFDLAERLDVGGIVPAAECPDDDCGAFVYLKRNP